MKIKFEALLESPYLDGHKLIALFPAGLDFKNWNSSRPSHHQIEDGIMSHSSLMGNGLIAR